MPTVYRHDASTVARKKVIGHSLAAADTWETLLVQTPGLRLALVYAIAWQDETGGADVRLRDSSGNGDIVSAEVSRDNAEPLIQSTIGLAIDGNLQAQVSDTAVSLSVWALEIDED